MAKANNTIPKLRVQRMGAKWRIVYDDSRCLAKFNSGEPLDGGGFEDRWENGTVVDNGQALAMRKMSDVVGGQTMDDPEEEGIGN